ncbi:MAG: hypothetical protein HRU09_00025 [Oligoflexales bacterium]|nr:hypothetical protein [Oligoflexales bacterium]
MAHQIIKYCEEIIPLIEKSSALNQEEKFSFFGHNIKGEIVSSLLSNKHFRHLIKEAMLWHEISTDFDPDMDDEDKNMWDEKIREISKDIQLYLDSVLKQLSIDS